MSARAPASFWVCYSTIQSHSSACLLPLLRRGVREIVCHPTKPVSELFMGENIHDFVRTRDATDPHACTHEHVHNKYIRPYVHTYKHACIHAPTYTQPPRSGIHVGFSFLFLKKKSPVETGETVVTQNQ